VNDWLDAWQTCELSQTIDVYRQAFLRWSSMSWQFPVASGSDSLSPASLPGLQELGSLSEVKKESMAR